MDNTSDPKADRPVSFSRRAFLNRIQYIGFGLGAGGLLACAAPPFSSLLNNAASTKHAPGPFEWVKADQTPLWRQPPYPLPLPGQEAEAAGGRAPASFEIRDELTLPAGFGYDILARWGMTFGQGRHQIRFGSNNDYTGMLPVKGEKDSFWLLVNHEAISARPWLQGYHRHTGKRLPELTLHAHPDRKRYPQGLLYVGGMSAGGHQIECADEVFKELPEHLLSDLRKICDAALDDLGVSILKLKRDQNGRFQVDHNSKEHKRISAVKAYNLKPGAAFGFTGPAAYLMAGRPRGTMSGCSGGVSSWGSFFSCEENFQTITHEHIGADGAIFPKKNYFSAHGAVKAGKLDDRVREPIYMNGMGHMLNKPLDGREYGWICEIDPVSGAMKKHTALGRFRHENIAVNCQAGKPLAAYMGDDRRGGHIYKFVSKQKVKDPQDPANSRLLEEGTLYAARFEKNYRGRWIPLKPDTPLAVPEPEHCLLGAMQLPARPQGARVLVGDWKKGYAKLSVDKWRQQIETFCKKPFKQCRLGDLTVAAGDDPQTRYQRQLGVILSDAFAYANAIGATPTARPEDLEVHPLDQSLFIAFTDGTPSGEGGPDLRIFNDAKGENSRNYGGVYRVRESNDDLTSETFTWGRFLASGEVADQGRGFAFADNMAFDPHANLWFSTDIPSSVLNYPVSRQAKSGTQPGRKRFPGVFGNNALFMVPTSGPQEGRPFLFATAPCESEFTGPTFTPDGGNLILSVQHPGEIFGACLAEHPSREETMLVRGANGQMVEQRRTIPIGSNWPSQKKGVPSASCVVCIYKRAKG